jgi:hypothetical protein
VQKDNEVFQRELNPPVIQVTEDVMDGVETEQGSVPPRTPTPSSGASKNPFLNREEVVEDSDVDGPMDVEKLIDVEETNPFRRLSGETKRMSGQQQEGDGTGWKVLEEI